MAETGTVEKKDDDEDTYTKDAESETSEADSESEDEKAEKKRSLSSQPIKNFMKGPKNYIKGIEESFSDLISAIGAPIVETEEIIPNVKLAAEDATEVALNAITDLAENLSSDLG